MDPIRISRSLCRSVAGLRFGPPVRYVYNPTEYARECHELYLSRHAHPGCEALLVGMNPGPFGMVQTGVPFGEVELVREWLGIECRVGKPREECPERPVLGFACHRREVSGRRLWGWARERFGTPEAFFRRFFVWNYCPLAFLEESGRNRTPDKLPEKERAPLFAACDQALARIVEHLGPAHVIGIGRFAFGRARRVLGAGGIPVGCIPHPSPASPAANNGWVEQAETQLAELGLHVGGRRDS